MKRPLPVFIILAIFFGLSRLPSVFAQTQITLDQSFAGTVYLVENPTSCGGRVDLVNPKQQEVLTYTGGQHLAIGKIGPFAAGSELVFSLTPNLPCSTQTLFSNNPSDAYTAEIEGQENMWGFAWFVPGQTKEIFMFVGLVPAELTLPAYHPAIFIHGLGGRPEDWINGDKKVYFDTLKADPYNYPEDYLVAYSYADADNDPSTYDYQGDIVKISADLEDYVNELSEKHIADGGDGKVDLVGFSLGGLVARQYLNTHPANHKIRKVITIASPHEGAYILSAERWFDLIPFAGDYLKKAFNVFMENTLLGFMNFLDESGQPTDLDSVAIQQIVPGSNFLATINSLFWPAPEPEYEALYGDIDAEFRQKVFFFTLKKKFSIGDGFIKPESATGIPAEVLGEYGYSDPAILNIKIAKMISGEYEYVLDAPSISDLSVWHGKLIVRPDVVQKVIELLTAEN